MPESTESRRRRVQERLRDVSRILDLYKTSKGCADCGYRQHPAALHFDHIDPQSKRDQPGWRENRSKLTSRAKFEAYFAHVQAYCEVRCANCHAVRTMTERHWEPREVKVNRSNEVLFDL